MRASGASRRAGGRRGRARPTRRRWHGRPHLSAARHGRCAAPARCPTSRSPAWAPSAGSRRRVVPAAGYRLELIPPVPLPRKPSVDLAKVPVRFRAAVKAARASHRRRRSPTSSSASAATSVRRPTSPPAGPSCRSVIHEGNALPGLANRVGARFADVVATSFPDTELQGRAVHRAADPTRDLDPRPGRAARPGARPLRPRPGRCRPCWSRAARRAPAGSTARSRRRAATSPPPASRCCTSRARRARSTSRPTAATTRRPTSCVPYVDRMDLAYAAADATVGALGRQQRDRGCGGRAAGGLRAAADRQRRAGAQRRCGGRGRRRACWSTTTTSRPSGSATHLPALLNDADRLAAMSAAATGPDPPRRRRRAGPPDRGGGAPMIIAVPDRDPACRGAGPGALRRHRRRRAVRAGAHHGASAASRSPAATPRTAPALDALRGSACVCFVGHQAAHVDGADTVVVSTAVPADNPEVVRAQELGLRLWPRSAAVQSVMLGRDGGGRHRHARQDHDDLDARHRAARLRRRSVVRDRLDPQRLRAQRRQRLRRRLRRRGRRE